MMEKFGEPWNFSMQIWSKGVTGEYADVVAEFEETIGSGSWGVLRRVSDVVIDGREQHDGSMYYLAKADVINERERLTFAGRTVVNGRECLDFDMLDMDGKKYDSGYRVPVHRFFVKKLELTVDRCTCKL
jgi:hypothetical protein